MTTEGIAFGAPIVVGVLTAFVTRKWTLLAFLAIVGLAVGQAIRSNDPLDAPMMFILYFLVMATPVLLVGWLLGRDLRALLVWGRNDRVN